MITPSIVKAELEIPAGGVMLFQLLVTLALGALGLLLAVPLLAVMIVLVREIYSYDLLGLRNVAVAITNTATGRLVVNETTTADGPTNGQADEIAVTTVVENHPKREPIKQGS